jgi:hypothetical protein
MSDQLRAAGVVRCLVAVVLLAGAGGVNGSAQAQSYCVDQRDPVANDGIQAGVRTLTLVNRCPRAVRVFYAFHNLEMRPFGDQVVLQPDQSWSMKPRRNIGASAGSSSEYGRVELMGLCFEDDDRCRSNMLREQRNLDL